MGVKNREKAERAAERAKQFLKVRTFDFLKFGHFGSVFCVFQKRCFCENFRTLRNCLARTRGVEKFIFVLERVYIHRK